MRTAAGVPIDLPPPPPMGLRVEAPEPEPTGLDAPRAAWRLLRRVQMTMVIGMLAFAHRRGAHGAQGKLLLCCKSSPSQATLHGSYGD